MNRIARWLGRVRAVLSRGVEAGLEEPLTEQQRKLVAVLEVVRIEAHVPVRVRLWTGRPAHDRRAMARVPPWRDGDPDGARDGPAGDGAVRGDGLGPAVAGPLRRSSKWCGSWGMCRSSTCPAGAGSRKQKGETFDPATAQWHHERTVVERAYSRLKDEFGGRFVRVRGHAKVHLHLMLGVPMPFADQLLELAAT